MKNEKEFELQMQRERANREIAEAMNTWLGCYTEEVIARVFTRMDEIKNNPMAMMMIKELHERTIKEKEQKIRDMEWMLNEKEQGQEETFNSTLNIFHNHCIEHSKSYRDVLYDMYIG